MALTAQPRRLVAQFAGRPGGMVIVGGRESPHAAEQALRLCAALGGA